MKSDPRKKDTPQQFLVAAWVKEAGFGTTLEEDFPPYVVDVYIPDLHLGIELDGPHHFRKRDAIRDEKLLSEYSLEIWRFNNAEIVRNYKSMFIDNIIKFAQGRINAST